MLMLLAHVTHAQYLGGDGSGSNAVLVTQASCSPASYPFIYNGGNESAAPALLLTQASCAAVVMPSVFTGGDESSSSSVQVTQVSCAAMVYPSIFLGGDETASNAVVLTQTSCAPTVYPSIFAGGVDDGFSGTAVLQTSCVTPADPGIYAGGSSNVNTGVTYLTACAPFADFEADTQFVCEGDTVHFTDLSLGSPITWDWTFVGGTPLSSSQQHPSVVYQTAGVYDVQLIISTGTGGNSVTKTSYISVGARPSASLTAGGPLSFCGGDSVQLTVNPAAASYVWNSGQTTQSFYAANSGNYFCAVTGANGCSANSDTVVVTVLSNPVPAVTASGPTTLCDADTLVLTSSPGASYVWLPGSETTQALEVTTSGTYYVSVTYANGCSNVSGAVNAVFGTTPATPVVSASGPLVFCNGDSVVLTSSPAASYLWSPGATSGQTLVVKNSGTYYVETGNGTGCTSLSLPVTVTVLPTTPVPVITASGPLTFCAGDSVILTSSPAADYLWSPGAQTTQSITVVSSGTYYVEADNGSNCPSLSLPVSVVVNPLPATPTVSASGPLTFCSGSSVILTASAAANYLWSPGGETTQSITVNSTGNYTVQTANGACTATSAPLSVTVNATPSTPVITASGPTTFCMGDSVILTSSAAGSYLWSPGGQMTQSITVLAGGTYSVLAGNGTGCTAASLPVTITVNPVPATPTITASGPLSFCSGDSVVLTASAAASYQWYPGGETTQSITVLNTGNYYVETGNGTGCIASSAPMSVSVNAVPSVPVITASGSTTFCMGDSVILTSSASGSYLWSPGGQTTQSITVLAGGTYTVLAGNGTGCTAASLPVTITVNPVPATPTITASGPLSFCSGDSVVLTASAAASYQWYPGGETTQSITVLNTGNYYVETGNGTGCIASSAPMSVTVNAAPSIPVITASGPTTFCMGDSVILTSSAAGSYLWYPGGESTQSITVSASGNYYVEALAGACSAASAPVSVTVLASPAVPVVSASGPLTFCEGDSVVLTSSLASAYEWNPGGEITQSLTVLTSGTYFVQVSNASGCTAASAPLSVVVNPAPVVNLNGASVACLNTVEAYTTTNLAGTSYLWTVNNGSLVSGSGSNSIQVLFPDTGAADVLVVVIDTATGCSASQLLNLSVLPAPQAYAGADVSLCEGSSVQLQASGGSSYAWQPPAGLSDPAISNPLASPNVTTAYVVVVANGSCTDSDTVLVTVYSLPVADAGPDQYISDDSCAVLAGSGTGTYAWWPQTALDNPLSANPTACPDSTMMYFLTVTGSGGCSATDSVSVYVSHSGDELVFPNTFTPNGDGRNDVWFIEGLSNYPLHRLTVFNRWGNQVFDAQPYENNWDGTSLGRELPDGTYYYVFDPGNGEELWKGYLMIIR